MENEEETFRLEAKTDAAVVEKQALWAGIKPGMRVADLGCGVGKTTSVLNQLVMPQGAVVGVDFSQGRIDYANQRYAAPGTEFLCRDVRYPLDGLGSFDLVWVRFVMEYYRHNALEILHNISRIVKPGGILCIIDLDHNCLNHFGMTERMERTLIEFMRTLEEKANFDPYAGRKFYSYLYKLGYRDLQVDVGAHHLIYGELNDVDGYNWVKKIEVASKKIGFAFKEYEGGYAELMEEFQLFFNDPARFSYTPIISVRGQMPGP